MSSANTARKVGLPKTALRLDLTDAHCRVVRDAGVLIAISSDAHAPGEVGSMRFGIGQARRGWLEPKDVLNTRSLSELLPQLSATMARPSRQA